MIPNPIHKVLSTFQNCKVRALLMGGQACVFYESLVQSALDDEERAERLADKAYWDPLKRELEQMRRGF